MTTDALHIARRFDRGSWLTLGFVLAPNFWLNGIL